MVNTSMANMPATDIAVSCAHRLPTKVNLLLSCTDLTIDDAEMYRKAIFETIDNLPFISISLFLLFQYQL